jgi:transposase
MNKITMGIDVDSKKLKCCVVIDEERSNALWHDFENQEKDFSSILNFVRSNKVSLVLMEASGGYEQKIALYLSSHKVKVHVINPHRVRSFARGIGLNYKNDKIDAFAIGLMGKVATFPPATQPSPNQQTLKELVIRRIQLKENIVQEKNRIGLTTGKVRESISRHIEYLEQDVLTIDEEINQVIKADEKMLEEKKVLTRFKGIADVTAAAIISLIPELGYIGNKEVSALVGVAPMDNDSGNTKGKRSIIGGRRHARKALYMPAWVAVARDMHMKKVYQRHIDRGKLPKVAIVSIMRKMLIRANASYRNYLEAQQALLLEKNA